MNIEAISRSKYKTGNRPGDDLILIEPDQVLAVFDGATDPTGADYQGESSGRIAARAAARCISDLRAKNALDTGSAGSIFQAISDAVKAAAEDCRIAHPPSTTAAIAVKGKDSVRILALGDTGVRINGKSVYQHHKIIDTVSTAARISVFKTLTSRMGVTDEAEYATRRTIFLGLAASIDEGRLNQEESSEAMEAAARASGLDLGLIADFLMGGIRTQFHYANAHHQLGYASLNGSAVLSEGVTDIRLPVGEIETIEIFSDGYVSIPSTGATCADWEAEFARVEQADFHKTGLFPAVKGSTSVETCDDRTVISASF
ncbi:protein phosphatase 2C domain-containing protein [Roseibium suaedae]|uniref:Protein phosphatase 2C n=1 Tax=Roseibium suaedae TaxID=735517 RepID=A0A1M7NV12_9HYPH|nr:protein phosphatase 2C domain-containing protein [Roseibium suaedae]SHN07979.1 Protein phosphatase 2C [Roseibium suaedae]